MNPFPTGNRYALQLHLVAQDYCVLGVKMSTQLVWKKVLTRVVKGEKGWENAPIEEGLIVDPRYFVEL